MELIRGTRLEHGHVVWPLRPRAPMMLFVVKATFDIQVGGEATLADEQPPCTGPLFLDDDVDRPLVYPGDFDPLKPVGECFLVGTCHPPGGGAVASEVRLEVGPVKKTVAVFGDRRFRWGVLGKGASAPERFERMPLSWERAFGGPGYGPNPWGRGFAARAEGESERQLPNLEDPARLIDSSSARPTPAGFSPIHPASPSRLAFAGTYDERWKARRFPYFPTDLDPRYFLSSPADQRAPGPWTGKERVRVTHAHPDHPELTTTLPGVAPRAFAHRVGEALDAFFEVALTCDTIVVDTDAMRITTVHRGLFEVKDSEGSDIERIFVTHDVGRKASHYECRTRYEAHLRLRDLEQNGFAPLNPSDDGDARTMMLVRAHLDELRTDPSSQATLHEAFAVPVGTGGATLAEVMLADVMPVVVVGSPEAPAPEAAAPQAPAMGSPAPKLEGARVEAQFGAIGEPVPPAVAAAVARDEASVPDEEDAPAAPEADAGADAEDEPADEASAERSRRALALFAEGEPLRGDWSELSLQEEFLEELDAAGALLSGANLRGARLSRARLAGCSLAGACLSGADLRGADLQGADLTGAKLDDALLDGATLDGATLERASLQRASLREASLLATEAPRANLNEAILEGAKADELDLSRGSLRSARAGGGSFQNARLIGVDATAAIFEGADLTKLRAYGGACFEGADLRGAKADGARFRGSSLVSASFLGASLVRSDFRGSNLEGASLDGCALKKAKFGGANLTRTRVRGSDLMQASLTKAVLSETDFSDSNLFAAELHEAIRDRARFSGTVLTGTKWEALA